MATVGQPEALAGATSALFENWSDEHLVSVTESHRSECLALTLYRFIHGDLAGLFDGEDEPMVFGGRLVVLDLSAQWSSNSFPVASALSAVAAAQQVVAARERTRLPRPRRKLGVGPPGRSARVALVTQFMEVGARARGLSHVLGHLHRWSDVAAVGDVGSADRERAQGLLRECETA